MLTRAQLDKVGVKVPVTIGSGIPDEWKVEHGYAEWKNPSYTNPQVGDRVHVMPSSSAWSELAGSKGEVVKNAYSYGPSTMIDVRFDDGETKSVSNQVLMREDQKPFARRMPGADHDRMTFRYLFGTEAPANRNGAVAEQFTYKPRRNKAEQAARVAELTGGGV